MPHIGVAMASSLRGGFLESRSIISEASDVKNTFSSWNNCMAKTYCKWPVIAAIIVASLILLSVVACIVRCACCGLSCCCSCFSCLKCCGNCCGCCDDPKGKKHKHLDDDYASPFAPQTGYKPPMPMMTGGIGATGPPQYAQFETGPNGLAVEPKKVVNEDALPPMPSWEAAQKKRIAQEEADAVEMGELDPSTGQRVPLMTGAGQVSRSNSPGHIQAEQPYGDRQGMDQSTVYVGAGGAALGAGVLGAGAMAMDHNNDPYGNGREMSGANRGSYGNGRGGYPPGPGRGYENPYDDQSTYGGPNGNFAPIPASTYPPRRPPQRQYSDSNDSTARPFPGDRQYSDPSSSQFTNPPYSSAAGPYGNSNQSQTRIASPPINMNSGFDFGGGSRSNPPPQQPSYSSSQQGGNYAPTMAPSIPPSYRTNSPPRQEASYPGYQPYKAPRQQGGGGRGGPPNVLMPGPRGGYQGYDGY